MRTFRWMGLALVGVMAGCYEDPVVAPNPAPEKVVFVASGALVTERVDEFRSALGPPNGGTPGDQLTGRREIAWDAGATAPFDNRDDFPSDFFNTVLTLGATYKTNGTGLRNDTELFRGINPTYSTEFNFFSPVKIFSPIGGNILDQLFEVAGQRTPAVSRGFGIVFSDVDLADRTTIELFAPDDSPLGTFSAPVRSDEKGLSFVGVIFEDPIVARVRITLGTGAMGTTVNDLTSGGRVDVVVLDNVIYGEPREIPSR